jgi:hypothetical protein
MDLNAIKLLSNNISLVTVKYKLHDNNFTLVTTLVITEESTRVYTPVNIQ